MKKLASMPLDIVDEILQEDLESLLDLVQDLPESVKTAHIPTLSDIEEMEEENFALVMFHPKFGFMKKYANNTSEITQLNTKLFLSKLATIPDELCEVTGKNLYRAHTQHKLDIPENLEKFASEEYVDNVVDLTKVNELTYFKKLEKVEIPEIQVKLAYALPGEERFPIHDEFHRQRAIEFFEKNSSVLDIASRVEYASNIVESEDVSSHMLTKYANINLEEFNDDVDVHIKSRKRVLKHENHKYLDGLREKMAEIGPLQTCLYLEEIDKTFGLDNLYKKEIEDAPLSVFALHKEASIKLKDGSSISKDNLDTVLGHEKVSEMVSEDLLKALNTDNGLHIFELMPADLQTHLKGLL